MKNLRILTRLIQYLVPYWGQLTFLIIISIVNVIFVVGKPLPVKIIIDNVLLKQELPEFLKNFLFSLNIHLNTNSILTYSLVIMAIFIIGGVIINYISFLLINKVGIQLIYDLSLDLYTKFQSLSRKFYLQNKIGDLLQRFNGDIFVVYLLRLGRI